jgi:hypothetical protein
VLLALAAFTYGSASTSGLSLVHPAKGDLECVVC